MLAKPSINDLVEKTHVSRYVTAIAISKRARQISRNRIVNNDPSIEDAVQVATMEVENDETIIEDKSKEEEK